MFGRNASGGVISIFTKDPSFQKPELRIKAGYGNYDTRTGQLYASTPIGDQLAADFSVAYRDQRDGYGTNIYNGADIWRDEFVSLRSKLVWAPTDATTVKAIAYYQDSYNTKGIYARPIPGTVAGSPDGLHNPGIAAPVAGFPTPSVVLPTLGFYDVNINVGADSNPNEQYDDSEGSGFSVRIDQETPWFDIVSITAARKNDEVYNSDGDNSPYDFLHYTLNIVDKQESQELQLKSKAESPISWIVGAYYLNAFQGFEPTTITGPGANAATIQSLSIIGKQRVKSRAGFGQVTVPVTDKFNITGGCVTPPISLKATARHLLPLLPRTPSFLG